MKVVVIPCMKAIDQNVTFFSGLKIIDCAIRFFKPTPTAFCHMRGLILSIGSRNREGRDHFIKGQEISKAIHWEN